MADDGIFCDQPAMLRKCGANISAVISGDATFVYSNDFISQAESEINTTTRYNWSDAYAALNVDVKSVLTQAASNLAAIYAISYDMSGFTTRGEAEDMINILRDAYLRAVAILRQDQVKTFVQGA